MIDENTVELVFGNCYARTPSIEVYDKGGVQITEGEFFISDKIHIFRAQ